MTKREAKRLACDLTSRLIHVDSSQDGWLEARLDGMPDGDRDKVIAAVKVLARELARRGKVVPK